jgi:hypothetical protein
LTGKTRAQVEARRQELIRERDEHVEAAKTPEQRTADASNLDVARRLSNRHRDETVTITLEDPDGDINVEIRTPTMRVITEYQTIQKLIASKFKDVSVEEMERFEDRLCHILGDDICTSPDLNYDYWKHGNYDPGLPFEIMALAIRAYNRDVDAGRTFRHNTKGKTPRGTVHQDGKEAR